MANNYYGWNYGGVMDQFGGCYPTPPAYSMTQTVAYPNVQYSTSQYGPYGTIITNPVVPNVAIGGPPQGQSPGFKDAKQNQAGKSEVTRSNTTSNSNGPQNATSAQEIAFFNAAKTLLDEKQKKFWGGANKDRFRSGRGPVIDPQQWKYCELCKCTCAGEQAYKAHLVGKAHKKKEALGASAAMVLAGSKGHMYCRLCEVSCSSSDAYDAHIKGAKHQKVMKVQMKMGKYVPDAVPEVSAQPKSAKMIKVEAGPVQKINFVGAPQAGYQTNATTPTSAVNKDGGGININSSSSTGSTDATDSIDEDKGSDDPSIGPIGLEYITEMMNETNTAPMFYCKLCDCSFSDPLAKMMHSKGRRHRLQYKKKVDPSLKVDVQSTYSDRLKNQWRNKRKDSSDNYRQQAEYLRYEKELLEWQLMKTQNPDLSLYPEACGTSAGRSAGQSSVTTSSMRDNQHIMAKHGEIYPTEEELKAVQEFVSTCERSLKMVSDKLAEKENARVLKGVMRVGLLAKGLLIRDLLRLELVILTSERPTKKLLQIVAAEMPEQMKTFSERPFKVELSPDVSHLKVIADGGDDDNDDNTAPDGETKSFSSYNITCLIFVASSTEYTKQKEKLFSKMEDCPPAVEHSTGEQKTGSEDPAAKEEYPGSADDYVDGVITEWALGELMRTKWFQINSMSSPASSIVVRILMDFCRRIPTWTPLGQWALELLVERCMNNNNPQKSPASAMRRVFEVVSSGIFLQDGWGLMDICEDISIPVDAVAHMCAQEREDITNSSQHALRLMALGCIHKVLGIAKLPPPPLMGVKRPRSEDW